MAVRLVAVALELFNNGGIVSRKQKQIIKREREGPRREALLKSLQMDGLQPERFGEQSTRNHVCSPALQQLTM